MTRLWLWPSHELRGQPGWPLSPRHQSVTRHTIRPDDFLDGAECGTPGSGPRPAVAAPSTRPAGVASPSRLAASPITVVAPVVIVWRRGFSHGPRRGLALVFANFARRVRDRDSHVLNTVAAAVSVWAAKR